MSVLVVALDVPSAEEAERVVDELYELDLVFKIGLEALLSYRERIVAYCESRDVRCCIDAKLHDIPRTVAAAARQLVSPVVRAMTVHACGGVPMMRAAVESVAERAAELGSAVPAIFAVTLLTSLEAGSAKVARLASAAREAGCAGIVCSANELADIKAEFGDELMTLVPGIRPQGSPSEDQRRVATPATAVAAGADYIVVGRPVLRAANRRAAAQSILDQMAAAL
ncbi:MAG: orotidine-5'-phosphate decarboxylase [Candidatus Tyrphobacter sp.]